MDVGRRQPLSLPFNDKRPNPHPIDMLNFTVDPEHPVGPNDFIPLPPTTTSPKPQPETPETKKHKTSLFTYFVFGAVMSGGSLSLAGTGVALGVVHVLTGPDHLSALATLSATVGGPQRAFLLGVRWGLGHSTGLLIVGVALILVTRNNQEDTMIQVPHSLSTFFESLVGIFMLLLGSYGMRKAWGKRQQGDGDLMETEDPPPINDNDFDIEGERNDDVEVLLPSSHQLRKINTDQPSFVKDAIDHHHFHIATAPLEDGNASSSQAVVASSHVSTRTLAICAGIVHGLAGPGGVLGVIPAVQLHDGRLATLYLSCFCVSSTLTMGMFATLYGCCSSGCKTFSSTAFWIEAISASFSIVVGVLWLALLSVGKLEDVFP